MKQIETGAVIITVYIIAIGNRTGLFPTGSPVSRVFVNMLDKLISRVRFHRELVSILLEKTAPVKSSRNETEVHSVICHSNVDQYILSIKSLVYLCPLNLTIALHDDGSLTKDDIARLERHIIGVKIYDYKNATDKIKTAIKGFPHVYRERTRLSWNKFHLIAILDVPFFAHSKKLVYLDSDILFFSTPLVLCNWIESGDDNTSYFMNDWLNGHSLTPKQLEHFIGGKIIKRYNSGLRFFLREKSLNLREMNDFLGYHERLGQNNYYYRDQTYAMVNAVLNYRKNIRLDKGYLVSTKPMTPRGIVCRHYFEPVREKLYSDGIKLLAGYLYNLFDLKYMFKKPEIGTDASPKLSSSVEAAKKMANRHRIIFR